MDLSIPFYDSLSIEMYNLVNLLYSHPFYFGSKYFGTNNYGTWIVAKILKETFMKSILLLLLSGSLLVGNPYKKDVVSLDSLQKSAVAPPQDIDIQPNYNYIRFNIGVIK